MNKDHRSNAKKAKQLGMNPSTASGRLIRDILFKLVVQLGYKCFQCHEDLTREDFSIEHKKPWLDSEKPLSLFFDQSNIAFSHLSCNSRAARRKGFKCGTLSQYRRGCRCDDCQKVKAKEKSLYLQRKRINAVRRNGDLVGS